MEASAIRFASNLNPEYSSPFVPFALANSWVDGEPEARRHAGRISVSLGGAAPRVAWAPCWRGAAAFRISTKTLYYKAFVVHPPG
jgi:hypothetical protein